MHKAAHPLAGPQGWRSRRRCVAALILGAVGTRQATAHAPRRPSRQRRAERHQVEPSARVRRHRPSTATRSATARDDGHDHHLRRHHPGALGARPPRPRGQRHARLRGPRRLHERRATSKSQPVLRRDHRPLRQPHRQGARSRSTARRTARHQQRPEQPARRLQGLRQAVWDAEDVRRRRRTVGVKLTRTSADGEGCTPTLPSTPPCTTGYPGNAARSTVIYTLDKRQQPAHRLQGDDRQADGRQPHQPLLLEPRRRGLGDDLRPPAHAQRRRATRRSTRR